MNDKRLKQLEAKFYARYPDGWESEELKPILKKHKVGKMEELAQEILSYEGLERELEASENITKLIAKSSLVSVFEKVKFKNLMNEMDDLFKRDLVSAVRTMLHEDEEKGFTRLVKLLAPYKMAKWPIITVLLTYFEPKKNVFVKPTTVKHIIQYLELEGLTYTSKVNYEFYHQYRQAFLDLTSRVNPGLSVSNGHFSGFLMMTME